MRKIRNHTWVECPYCKHHYWLHDYLLKEDSEKNKKDWCSNSTGHIEILKEERFNSVTVEKRQEILDLMRIGITVGHVSWLLELDSSVVAEVICRNIKSAHFLRSESL